MGNEAVRFYSQQFQGENFDRDWSMLNHIPKLITDEENEEMVLLPEEQKVREAVFGLNENSAVA